MEVYLVRHTQTVCKKEICYGQSDVGLLAPYLPIFEEIKAQIPVGATVYSSPLSRCVYLAKYLSESPILDHRLLEMNFGDWELQPWNAIAPEELQPWMDDFVNIQVPNGESFVELYQRVDDFFKKELLSNPSGPVVLVTHAGVIRSILCKISSLALKDAFQNKVDFGAVIQIKIG
ncbi:alpha-ribazole phosphatase family protein [Flavobacterium crassostreae]|uniref:Alpha-ribazole phosphatase n=1 Tax=Flavobacterium crassostreae TaxID=1763534 RepID=A0A1B9E7E8_9FLAO|nr:alpha-ribazole phosphatase family protein [Flavobacterium crassostreae]OCB77874.1 alpha-ribazole phosphatase [Flavobacterium crassostreae]